MSARSDDDDDASRRLLFDLGGLGAAASPAGPTLPTLRANTMRGTSQFVSGGVGGVSNLGHEDVVSMLSGSPFDQSPMFRTAVTPVCMFLTNREGVMRYCLGRIGTKGEKACTRDTLVGEESCSIGTHSHKAQYEENTLYFWDSLKNVLYLKTQLPFSEPLADSVYDMRNDDLTHMQVREMFELVVEGAVGSTDGLMAAKAKVMRPGDGVGFTPRKKPRFSSSPSMDSVVEVDVMDTIAELEDDPLLGEERLEKHVFQNWGKLVQTVGALRQSAGRNRRSEEEITRLGDDVDGLNAAGRRLMSLVGVPRDGASLDLFHVTEDLDERVSEMNRRLKALAGGPNTEEWLLASRSLKELQEFRAKWEEERDRETGGDPVVLIDGAEVSFTRIARTMMKTVAPAIKDLWEVHGLLTRGPDGQVVPGSRLVRPGQHLQDFQQATGARLAELEDRLKAVEAGKDPHPPLADAGLGDLFGGLGEEADVGETAADFREVEGIGANDGRIAMLEAKLADVESRLGAVTVECGGFTFRNPEDCVEFVSRHVPGQTYAFFYDMVSLLQRAWGDTHVGVQKHWEDLYSRKKAGFSNLNEAVITASMTTVLPTCLGEDPGRKADPNAALSAVPTHGYWTSSGGQSGRKPDINRSLQKTRPTLETQIRNHFRGSIRGAGLVKELMLKAKSHWTAFEQMLDGFYDEFCAHGPDKEAWVLASLIGKTIFEVLNEVRATAADLSDCATPLERSARVLWATLQAMRVMDEFVHAEFRNHPRVASVIVLHLFENRVPRSEFVAMRDEHQLVVSNLDSLVSQMNAKLGGGYKLKK
jgi:hypothetical protein